MQMIDRDYVTNYVYIITSNEDTRQGLMHGMDDARIAWSRRLDTFKQRLATLVYTSMCYAVHQEGEDIEEGEDEGVIPHVLFFARLFEEMWEEGMGAFFEEDIKEAIAYLQEKGDDAGEEGE